MTSIRSHIASLGRSLSRLRRLDEKFDEIKINQGRLLTELHGAKESTRLQDYEFKVFSQWGEDGIIQRLINAVPIVNRTFIEFGVEDFLESDCRFLLMKDDWTGFVMDGSARNIARLKASYFYWKHDLAAIDAFVTGENINDLLARSGFDEDLGILCIDLDGNDYYILDAIRNFRPRILICEYNSVFGPVRKIAVPYEADFNRTIKHYSNLYWGASLAAIAHGATKKGYSLVGTNSACNNAFFVRNDLVNPRVEVLRPEQAYAPSRFRESRDQQGNLTFVSGEDRRKLIEGLPVMNIETNAIETL